VALTWNQVSAITSKKFLPKLIDNVFDSNPYMERVKRNSLMKIDGGDSIMQPLEYSTNSSNGWYSGSETLDTSDNEQITAAQYDWKFFYVNLTILRTEELRNSGDSAKLNMVKSKVKNAEKTMSDILGTALYNDGTNAKAMSGLRHSVAIASTVGGISQSSYSWWQGQVDSTTTTMTMGALQSEYSNASIGNDTPSVILSTRSNYDRYYALLQPQQRFMDSETAKGGFTSLMYNGTPWIADSHCPANHVFMVNEKYMPLVAHRDEYFRFEPFVKPVNQNIRLAKLYFAGNMAPSNNRMHAKFSAITA